MKLEEVLPALREGKNIRRSSWLKNWDSISSFSIYANEPIYGALDNDWEIDPDPKRVADYFVPIQYSDKIYAKQTHPIGQQPEGSVLVPGSEREDSIDKGG